MQKYLRKAEWALLAFVAIISVYISSGYAKGVTLPPPELPKVEPYAKAQMAEGAARADKGDPAAHYRLGYMYHYGLNVPVDARKAAYHMVKAAEGGDANGQVALGRFYKEGVGVAADYARALEMFNKAAKAKNGLAYYELGLAYEEGQTANGRGVFQSYDHAIRYFNAAGDGGIAQGYLKVAEYYQNGIGVKRDLEKAITFYGKVAGNDDPAFKKQYAALLAELYLTLAAQITTPEDKIKWYLKAAETGDVNAQLVVAKAYLNGQGIALNESEARAWFEKAAAADNQDAIVNLAYMYANGVGVEIDYKKAAELYTRAAEQGNSEAAWNLGNFYANGYGVEQDGAKSQEWYRRSQILSKAKPK